MGNLSKSELHRIVVETIIENDWNLLYLNDENSRPFNLQIYQGNESFQLRVYIWNLTPGGTNRKADEFRIQPKVGQFESGRDFKTLIIGWQSEIGVFGGWDLRKHIGEVAYSGSLQIKHLTLERAYTDGMAAQTKGNNEVAIAFKSEFFIEYVRSLEELHEFGRQRADFEALQSVLSKLNKEDATLNNSDITQVTPTRQIILQIINRRVRDAGFQRRVLRAYDNRCAFCSVQLNLVDAAHIIPVKHPTSTDRTDNGMALCALHHRAYDNALVTVTEDYEVIHSEDKLERLRQLGHDGGKANFISQLRKKIDLPPAVNQRPNTNFIREANQLRRW